MSDSSTWPTVAFKEWSVVCAALADGTQRVIIRKGGIHEGDAGFRVAHRRFWLYPTMFHQRPDLLRSDYECRPDHLAPYTRDQDRVPLQLIVNVTAVRQIVAVAELSALEPLTILHRTVLDQRFAYREPGLFVLDIDIERIPEPRWIVETPEYAGCKSWVELTAL